MLIGEREPATVAHDPQLDRASLPAYVVLSAMVMVVLGATSPSTSHAVDQPLFMAHPDPATTRYLRRTELITDPALAGAPSSAAIRALLTFTQFTDIHLIDEESPLRTEFLDSMLGTAYRPQEGFSPQVLAWMAHLARTARSPFTGHGSDLVITTGDSSDNSQRNEVRWLIDILDGGHVNPDSGVPGTCGTAADGHTYDGVAHGSDVDLVELMNRPFQSEGVDQPWYAAFGNHDGLVAGNVPVRPEMIGLATGCVKVLGLPPQDIATITGAGDIYGRDGLLQDAFDRMAHWADLRQTAPAVVRLVPSDADRRPLTRTEYMAEHFETTGSPVGHGFERDDLATGHAWYSFRPAPGVRFLVLDTVAPTGGHNGAIVDEQFRWIQDELVRAEQARELVLVFGHHTLRTITQRPDTTFAVAGGAALPVVHFGLPATGAIGCAAWDPIAPTTTDESLACLLLRHPAVIAYINGHEHRNLVAPVMRPTGSGIPGGFWEVTTASHIDWPQEARLLDLVDDQDGYLSIVATVIGQPAIPDASAGPDGSVERLAAMSHQLAWDDPQGSTGRNGGPSAAGDPKDRDVELLVPNPYVSR